MPYVALPPSGVTIPETSETPSDGRPATGGFFVVPKKDVDPHQEVHGRRGHNSFLRFGDTIAEF
jgi:hypothetical protein